MTEAAPGRFYAHLNDKEATFEPDRNRADEFARRVDGARLGAQENRAWVLRATRHAAMEGVSQFIDLGAGPPMNPSVAGTARNVDPSARVIYVDNDPVITAHSRAVDARGAGITAITGDARDAAGVFTNSDLRKVIDPRQPVCVLLAAVLHFMPPEDAEDAVQRIRSLIAPGSLVAISVGIASAEVVAEYNEVMGAEAGFAHTRDDIEGYFEGLNLIEPEIVWARDWRPDSDVQDASGSHILAGVGRKP
jgi:O-methyltransferase involved in polyketide biosynthesis